MDFFDLAQEVFVPDGGEPSAALAKTTDLCIAAHQDDIEIMAYGPIAACFDDPGRFFSGCVVSNGAGSPREGRYGKYTDGQMKEIRISEQKNAARVGNYSALAFIGLDSQCIKDFFDISATDAIEELLLLVLPDTVYTHNLADKHDTHVAVALRVIEAAKRLPIDKRPAKVYSMEVWRGLDWLRDVDKTVFDTSPHPNLAAALLGVYDSQIAGGKRYDSAALGRRLANATFFESHETDGCPSLNYGLDITELIACENEKPEEFIRRYIKNFSDEVSERLAKLARG